MRRGDAASGHVHLRPGGAVRWTSSSSSTPALGQWPQAFCHRESGWQTNIKGLASYTVPKIDVLLSGTLHSVPYPGNNFPSVTSQSLGGQVLAVPIAEPILDGRSRAGPDRVLEHRRARAVVRRSPEPGRYAGRQEPALRAHENAGRARHLQSVQLEHAGRVSTNYSTRGDVRF